MMTKKIAKCPKCCPDGGARFVVAYDYDTEKYAWRCQNCHTFIPRRPKSGVNRITPSIARVLDQLAKAGWKVTKQEWIGRRLWIEAEHPRSWILGNSTHGTIGKKGAYCFSFHSIGTTVKITDDIGFRVYLGEYR